MIKLIPSLCGYGAVSGTSRRLGVVVKWRNIKKEKISSTICRGNSLSPFIDMCWQGEYGEIVRSKNNGYLGYELKLNGFFSEIC